jgi:alkylhydroperoxidase family enzyme
MATAATTTHVTPFLAPVEKPDTLFLKLGYHFMRKKFGKVMTPASVFSARMPTAFTLFYGKIGNLDKKLEISADLVLLLRESVAMTNGCLFCMDTSRAAVVEKSLDNEARFDALESYGSSPLFTVRERVALDYVTELTANRAVAPETFVELRRHFSERQICDIVWVAASEHLFNVSNIGLNIGSDGLCEIVTRERAKQLSSGR